MKLEADAFLNRWRDLGSELPTVARQALDIASTKAHLSAKNTTLFKNRTGKTRRGITKRRNGFRASVIARGVAKYLEEGTRPHPIVASRGGFLRFQVNGTWVTRQSVSHPGTAPRPFMKEAREVGYNSLMYALDTLISSSIKRFRA